MAIRDRQNLLDRVTAIIGEDKNDDAISLVEDLTDTLDDFETKSKDQTDWKARYEENDKAWRDKYVARFKAGVVDEEDDADDYDDTPRPKTFEDLFSIKEK